MSKRILIVGYFYVDANMGGVRLRRIARLLPRYGWEPVILTHPADPAQNVQLPAGIRVLEVAAPDLTTIYSRLKHRDTAERPGPKEPSAKRIGFTSKINRWLMIPDKQVTWLRPAVRRGIELMRQERFDAIFASLDPRTSILAASRLSRSTGVPCFLEYRDLWTGNPYYHVTQPTAFHRWLHSMLEGKALGQATQVSAVCRGIAERLTARHGARLRQPVKLNYNFFDPEEYPPRDRAGVLPFTISYTGAMYAQRSPEYFLQGMRLFINRLNLGPEQIRFRWAGAIAGIDDLSDVLRRTGIRPYLDFLGQIPHKEALRELVNSDAALLIQAPHDDIHIPGKLFEAMGAKVPLLAIAHPCEVADIITTTRAGIVCPHTPEGVAAGLNELYNASKSGKQWAFRKDKVQEYSADSAVRKLAMMFDRQAD